MRISIILGTRPEIVKMFPVIQENASIIKLDEIWKRCCEINLWTFVKTV